jgi:hypothetical protein
MPKMIEDGWNKGCPDRLLVHSSETETALNIESIFRFQTGEDDQERKPASSSNKHFGLLHAPWELAPLVVCDPSSS